MKINKEIKEALAKFKDIKPIPCPVCKKDMLVMEDGHLFCGHIMLLDAEADHYILIHKVPETLPETGCPMCGKEMEDIGKFKWIFTQKEEGIERVICNNLEHYIVVTKKWYQKNRKKET